MAAIKRLLPGVRMSGVVIHNGVVYLKGQVGGLEGDVKVQAKKTLEEIEGLLKEAGTDKNHMLSATVFLSDIRNFAAFNEVWDAWVPKDHMPARACVQAPLYHPDCLCEVSVIAACAE